MTNSWENCELLADVVVANLPEQVKDDLLVWFSENWSEGLSYDLAIARKSKILDSGLRLRHNTPHEVAIKKARAYFSAWKYFDYKKISTLITSFSNVKVGFWDEIVEDIKNRNIPLYHGIDEETQEVIYHWDDIIGEYIHELLNELEIEHFWDNENLRALVDSGYDEIDFDTHRQGDTFTRVIKDAIHDLYRDFLEANAENAGVSW